MEFSSPKIKRVLHFLKKSFSYISGNETLKKLLLIFQEKNFPSSKNKKNRSEKISYIFSKKSFSYISGNGTC